MIALQPATAPKRTGADLIVHLLERQGVDIVAGIPGGALLPLYEALGRSTRIRHILARHEQAAGFIAQGMSRITRRAGVCFATSGPGVTNVVTALADAKLDSLGVHRRPGAAVADRHRRVSGSADRKLAPRDRPVALFRQLFAAFG